MATKKKKDSHNLFYVSLQMWSEEKWKGWMHLEKGTNHWQGEMKHVDNLLDKKKGESNKTIHEERGGGALRQKNPNYINLNHNETGQKKTGQKKGGRE